MNGVMFKGEMSEQGFKMYNEDDSILLHVNTEGKAFLYGPTGDVIFSHDEATEMEEEKVDGHVAALITSAYNKEGYGEMALQAFFEVTKVITQYQAMSPENLLAMMLEQADTGGKPN